EVFSKLDFHPMIVTYLYFVRFSGNITKNLEKCTHLFEQRNTYMKKMVQVLRYPIILAASFVLLMFFLRQSVLPSFSELFASSSTVSSTTLTFSLLFLDLATTLLLIMFILILVGGVGWFFLRKDRKS